MMSRDTYIDGWERGYKSGREVGEIQLRAVMDELSRAEAIILNLQKWLLWAHSAESACPEYWETEEDKKMSQEMTEFINNM